MNTSSAIRTKGRSDQQLSTDALKFYEDYWSQGTQIDHGNIEYRRALLRQVFPSGLAEKRVAELGVGGEGGFLYLLRDKNETFGFDASASAIELCRQRGLDVNHTNLDTDRLPLADGSMDAVFAMEVFEHFASPQFVLEEIHRVLAPRGIALISTPNPMVYHWPRLFYPELFQFDAFQDFVNVNGFKIYKTLGSKTLACKMLDGVNKKWHWIWCCTKLDMQDAQMLFELGLHFWDQKDDRGFRKKPIEAIDFFRRCYQLKPDSFPFRSYLTRALVYRCINGESEEFRKHYNYLLDDITNNSDDRKREALYHIAMMYVEFEKLGSSYMEKTIFDEAIRQLARIPGGSPYVDKIKSVMGSRDS